MQVELDKHQQEWLRKRVSAGEFDTVEAAVATAVQRMMLEDLEGDDDLAWTKSLIEEGLAQLERGESIAHDDLFADIEGAIASRK